MAEAEKKKSSCLGATGDAVKSLDQFQEGFVMKIDEEADAVGSLMGTGLSGILSAIMLIFIYTKATSWYLKNDVDIMSNQIEGHFTYEDKFDTGAGFFLAAAITEYNSDPNPVEEAQYGELIIEHYGWGYGDGIGSGSRPLNYHTCTDEELGYVRTENTVIYPVYESSQAEVDTYRKKFKCIPNEDLVIWGDYNSAKAQ